MVHKLSQKEIENLTRATLNSITYLKKFKRKKLSLRKSFFLMIHKDLLAHKKDAGKYRTFLHQLEIKGKTFTPCEAWEIENKIIELIEFVNNKHKWGPKFRKHILNRVKNSPKHNQKIIYKVFIAWYIHHKFTIIHPFTDGNGRTARLLMCLILKYEGLSEMSYPVLVNFIINKNKTKYLNSLNSADQKNYFIGVEYMLQVLKNAYQETIKLFEEQKKNSHSNR